MRSLFFILLLSAISASAQVGYQVSLLDKSTGEPRVNEKVSVTVKISDSKGTSICEEQKTVTSDAFGVLSLVVGNAATFSNVDWNNLPLSISATVDGILIGSSNILTVPIAEHAKHTGELTEEILCSKTWTASYGIDSGHETLSFSNGGCTLISIYIDGPKRIEREYRYSYYISGNAVVCRSSLSGADSGHIFYYFPRLNELVSGEFVYK